MVVCPPAVAPNVPTLFCSVNLIGTVRFPLQECDGPKAPARIRHRMELMSSQCLHRNSVCACFVPSFAPIYL